MKLEEITNKDPKEAFEMIKRDLITRLRGQGVRDYSIEGVKLALGIAFHLGEKSAAWKIGTTLAKKGGADERGE